MYAVMGITGNVGGAVARTLLAKGEKVRGIVRNPERAAGWQKQGVEPTKHTSKPAVRTILVTRSRFPMAVGISLEKNT